MDRYLECFYVFSNKNKGAKKTGEHGSSFLWVFYGTEYCKQDGWVKAYLQVNEYFRRWRIKKLEPFH